MIKKCLVTVSIFSFILVSKVQGENIITHQDSRSIVAPIYSWKGFYLGGQIGGFSGLTTFNYHKDNTEKWNSIDEDLLSELSGFTGGFYAGSNFDFGNGFIVGVDTDIVFSNKKDTKVFIKKKFKDLVQPTGPKDLRGTKPSSPPPYKEMLVVTPSGEEIISRSGQDKNLQKSTDSSPSTKMQASQKKEKSVYISEMVFSISPSPYRELASYRNSVSVPSQSTRQKPEEENKELIVSKSNDGNNELVIEVQQPSVPVAMVTVTTQTMPVVQSSARTKRSTDVTNKQLVIETPTMVPNSKSVTVTKSEKVIPPLPQRSSTHSLSLSSPAVRGPSMPQNVPMNAAKGEGSARPMSRKHDLVETYTHTLQQQWSGATRIRLGLAAGRFMPYIAGGISYTKVQGTFSKLIKEIGKKNISSDLFDSVETMIGYTLGGGFDFAMTDRVLIRSEYRYSDFGGKKFKKINSKYYKTNDVRIGLAYKF
ncbi:MULTISPECIES: outer membrane beta-barrel protein [unclassified Bartonella]|uniref:outer membrane beta-barrel protein n=1 Tax=unclassified Bartonella TaxID=2645622 RepID=UPI0009C3CD7E|nr:MULTISPECIES: outer membrane beta-barrel protein [unclassified Bartonella]AQX27644.1 Outer membrane protein beta-barrel domain-containing protein [Bartonella sp. JB15]AQX28925.1 Outer membrane protein beta-barrel domain-containing protein [Bartonella sp. JB63]